MNNIENNTEMKKLSKKELRNIFSFNLKRILKEKGIKQNELAVELNVPYQKVCDWCRSRTYPTDMDLDRLSVILNINKEKLVTQNAGTNEKIIINDNCVLLDVFATDSYFQIGKEPIPISEYNPAIYQVFFKIYDDNMLPKYDIGDLVLTEEINKNDWENLKDGDYFISNLDGDINFLHIYLNNNYYYVIAPLNPNNSQLITSNFYEYDDLKKHFTRISKVTKVIKYIK